MVAVPAEVEPGAGCRSRAAAAASRGRARDLQETAEQPGATPHLVRLREAREAREQRLALRARPLRGRPPRRAGHSGRPFAGRVEARERGRLAREHALVHGAEHAQRQEAAQRDRLSKSSTRRATGPSARRSCEGRVEQLRVQRRAEEPAGPCLETERREDRFRENGPPRGARSLATSDCQPAPGVVRPCARDRARDPQVGRIVP